MKKKAKFEPKDSNRRLREDDQIVDTDRSESQTGHQEESNISAPALKRKFSEQPPTKHNSKT
ncbi:hypothetical protein GCM10007415_36990 [Parapedobacter pyrenivorans]|uniref:Uncharacterized protein n=1 Tax=Parapedobacter pyrenivorans TaxID=1305674 RepID=A0A917HYC4_9SPHI|nr:hypothetical protein [Parapedobacter pyrenivorans]GGG98093.1 hypothetical protein GCM10007415_36990 [Parapedobacter pyrenivorans]